MYILDIFFIQLFKNEDIKILNVFINAYILINGSIFEFFQLHVTLYINKYAKLIHINNKIVLKYIIDYLLKYFISFILYLLKTTFNT